MLRGLYHAACALRHCKLPAAEAGRWDNVANTLRVAGYGTVDARVSWRFAPAWTLQAHLVNAFDRDYATSAWYAQPGREFGAGRGDGDEQARFHADAGEPARGAGNTTHAEEYVVAVRG